VLVGYNLYWFNLSDLTKVKNDIFDYLVWFGFLVHLWHLERFGWEVGQYLCLMINQ
jgi:hypothetical protein